MLEKTLSYQEALLRAGKYCALQERCASQLTRKFADWGVEASERDELLQQLTSLGYLNEERFAKAFARGKFNIHGWGRMKIMASLRQLKISEALIEVGLEEIAPDDYHTKLLNLLKKKIHILPKEMDEFLLRQKLTVFALSKGFLTEEIMQALKQIIQ